MLKPSRHPKTSLPRIETGLPESATNLKQNKSGTINGDTMPKVIPESSRIFTLKNES